MRAFHFLNKVLNKHTEKNIRAIRDPRGFTLIEIMVVVIIIGTIAGLVGVKYFDSLEKAKIKATQAQMANIKSALGMFRLDNHFYPLTQQGLQALVIPPPAGRNAGNFRVGGYLDADMVPLDPWDNEYLYVSDGQEFQLWSVGADGRNQTPDDVYL